MADTRTKRFSIQGRNYLTVFPRLIFRHKQKLLLLVIDGEFKPIDTSPEQQVESSVESRPTGIEQEGEKKHGKSTVRMSKENLQLRKMFSFPLQFTILIPSLIFPLSNLLLEDRIILMKHIHSRTTGYDGKIVTKAIPSNFSYFSPKTSRIRPGESDNKNTQKVSKARRKQTKLSSQFSHCSSHYEGNFFHRRRRSEQNAEKLGQNEK